MSCCPLRLQGRPSCALEATLEFMQVPLWFEGQADPNPGGYDRLSKLRLLLAHLFAEGGAGNSGKQVSLPGDGESQSIFPTTNPMAASGMPKETAFPERPPSAGLALAPVTIPVLSSSTDGTAVVQARDATEPALPVLPMSGASVPPFLEWHDKIPEPEGGRVNVMEMLLNCAMQFDTALDNVAACFEVLADSQGHCRQSEVYRLLAFWNTQVLDSHRLGRHGWSGAPAKLMVDHGLESLVEELMEGSGGRISFSHLQAHLATQPFVPYLNLFRAPLDVPLGSGESAEPRP
jgi:hypothetical protein